MKARIRCAAMTGMLLTSGLAFANADFVQGPFAWNVATKIVVDDNMRFVHVDVVFKKCWTNVEWTSRPLATAPVTDLTAKGWYNVMWPGAHPSVDGKLPVWSAVRFLSDGIYRMTGQRPASVGGHDYSVANAVVLTTLEAMEKGTNVPGGLLVKARAALAVKKGAPIYSANEAYYVRTEGNAIYIVANELQGLPHGVVELLLGDNAVSPKYQIGYEKLSLGPNWTYVPNFTGKPLVFNMEYAGRPGMYYRKVGPTRGFQNGATWATITYGGIKDKFPEGLSAPDETVDVSDLDWNVGFRMDGCSSPGALPSQNLESFAPSVVTNMVATGSDKGFLTVTKLGLDAERPAATKETANWLWLNTDKDGPNKGKIFECTTQGAKDHQLYWQDRSRGSQAPLTAWCPPFIDLSVPAVRDMLLKDMIKEAEAFWTFHPGGSYSYPHAEPSDGGLSDSEFQRLTAYPNWYADYRKAEGQPWGPYKLNGFYQGSPVQPTEGWWSTMTPVDLDNAQPDMVYALNNWLLREFDKYVKALSADQQLSGGKSKTELIHTLCYSYGGHDVPPNFNMDERVRMCVSIFAGHRGRGKWKSCQSLTDVMRGMQSMLPLCDMSQYWVYTISYPSSDWGLGTLGYGGFLTPETVHSQLYDNFYAVGGRNLGVEADVDFGKNALTFYMYAKVFWEPTMSLKQLQVYRDRWLKRAYGAAAFEPMSQYYDLMAPGTFVNAKSMWGRAIQLIQQADAVISAGTQEKQRLNELKQFWYWYYLQEKILNWDHSYKTAIEPATLDSFKELLWKGQTSYIVPVYCINWGLFRHLSKDDKIPFMFDLCSPTYIDKDKKFIAPAHFTAEETAAWWAEVVKAYPVEPVTLFKESKLVNGQLGSTVDLNNLTTVKEFAGKAPGGGVLTYMPHHAVQPSPLILAQKDGDTIGFKIFAGPDKSPQAFSVPYSVDQWDPAARAWKTQIFGNMVSSVNDGATPKSCEVATLTFSKTVAGGLYRINAGSQTAAGRLSSLDYDPGKKIFTGNAITQGLTFTQRIGYGDLAPLWYVYIPKGTKTLDVEVDDDQPKKMLSLYTGLPSGATPWKLSRELDIHGRRTHRILLQPGEDGSLALLGYSDANVPHFYSIPNIGALAPWMLMVPKDIAKADGLTPYQPLTGTYRR